MSYSPIKRLVSARTVNAKIIKKINTKLIHLAKFKENGKLLCDFVVTFTKSTEFNFGFRLSGKINSDN